MAERISIIGQVFPWKGGIAHYNSLLANELQAHAYVQVISFMRIFPRWIHPLKEHKDKASKNFFKGVAEEIFDVPNPFSWMRVVRALTQYRPEALIFHWYTPILAVPIWFVVRNVKKQLPQCKILAICHNVIPHERTPFDKMLTRIGLKGVDSIVVHSARDAAIAKEWMPGKRIEQLFHPIYDMFLSSVTRKEAREKLYLEKPTLLFFGGVRKYKGLDYLLRAMPLILEKQSVELIIAGEFFGNKKEYMDLIERYGLRKHIKLFDRYIANEEVGVFFRAADVVIAPYTSGTQSGALNIALAFEIPVIASDVGGFGEIVKDGENGYLVPPMDVEALANAVCVFLRNRTQLHFAERMRRIKKEHSWDVFTKKLLQVLSP